MSSERTNLNTFCHAYADVVRRGAFPKVPKPADATDAEAYPNITEACSWLASLPAERRAELEGDYL